MKQLIVVGKPPVYNACDKRFNIRGRAVIFSWGDTIFNPENADIPYELRAHEAAHGARQGTEEKSIRSWWDRYLADAVFRLEEEVLGHRAEWQAWVRKHPGRNCAPALEQIAGKLSSSLYGNIIALDAARERILSRA